MADSVYYHLERMLPQLDDLQQRGLFSKAEIKEIVRRRREFEFRLERRSRLKQDYLRYVEYETQLESLRKLRKKALIRQLKQSKKRWQNSLCDRASAMRIMLIYERAVTRFKGDLDLWLRYLEYCRSQGTRRMQKVLTKALQLHSTVPGLWIYAAAWEFEHNLNVAAARALMQRGLRICPHSESLWLEYFRMELMYAQRLKTTEVAMGVDSVEDEQIETNGNSFSEGEAFRVKHVLTDDLCYKLACTVYKNAIFAIPSSSLFRQRFIEVLENFDFEQAPVLQDEIVNSLAKDFPKDESCWDWQARRHLKRAGNSSEFIVAVARQRAVQVYEEALNAVPSSCMFELYIKFLEDLASSDGGDLQVELNSSDSLAVDISHNLLALYEKAEENGVVSSVLAEGHILLLLRLGKLDAASELAEKFCNADFKGCGNLWLLRMCLEFRRLPASKDVPGPFFSLFQQVLKQIPVAEAKSIWHMALKHFAGDVAACDKVLDMLVLSLGGCSNGVPGAEVACSVIDWFLCNQSIERARQAYNRLLSLPGPSLELYKHCIRVELRMVAMGYTESFQLVRSLFKSALEVYGQDAGLWLEYCSQEMKAGNSEAAGTVYWRAKKTLHDPSEFIEKYHQLVALGSVF